MAPMRVGYFGPEGTFTQEALIDATAGRRLDLVPLPTIYDTVMAVHSGEVERALVPIENSLEGSVNATLDALAMETEDVAIVGEVVHPIRHCLISKRQLELSEIEVVVSHPQASAQCARFIRSRLPQAEVMAGSSTAEAVRMVAEHGGPWAALENGLVVKGFSFDGTTSPGRCAINCNNQDVYSFHPGGANILFADGHVQFVSAGIDIREFVKMVTRMGGEVVLPP